ncbi:unnamed protein product, partial [Protopolystoma xenopodis]
MFAHSCVNLLSPLKFALNFYLPFICKSFQLIHSYIPQLGMSASSILAATVPDMPNFVKYSIYYRSTLFSTLFSPPLPPRLQDSTEISEIRLVAMTLSQDSLVDSSSHRRPHLRGVQSALSPSIPRKDFPSFARRQHRQLTDNRSNAAADVVAMVAFVPHSLAGGGGDRCGRQDRIPDPDVAASSRLNKRAKSESRRRCLAASS